MTIPPELLGRELEVEYGYYPYTPPTRYDPPQEELIEIIAVWEDGRAVSLHVAEEKKIIDYIGKKIHEKAEL